MDNRSNTPQIRNYHLEPGYMFVAAKPTRISAVLGSSVSVCLYDRKLKYGGMSNFRYPSTKKKQEATALYGNVSTHYLVELMLDSGSQKEHLEAQLFGGAHNQEISKEDIGMDNITTARKVLGQCKIPIVSEDVGGLMGRKVVFNTETAELAVMRVQRLRKEDWYPYESDR